MTFYNIISAALFIGALRELLSAFDAVDAARIAMALALAAIVFNDMLSTSYAVETKKMPYGWRLMLLDLANFILLMLALVSINPGERNIFNLELTRTKPYFSEATFWGLLGVYWLSLMLWSLWAGTLNRGDRRLYWSLGVSAGFFIVAVALLLGWEALAGIGRWAAPTYLILYLWLRDWPPRPDAII